MYFKCVKSLVSIIKNKVDSECKNVRMYFQLNKDPNDIDIWFCYAILLRITLYSGCWQIIIHHDGERL